MPIINNVIGKFDPTLLVNGIYDIRLSAADFKGNTASKTVTCLISGDLKVGINTITFTDLQVPVCGIPITINRRYDSRVKTKKDFGVGWSLDILDVDLRENRKMGDGWSVVNTGGVWPNWELRPSKVHIVVVTYPDGKTDVFDMVAYLDDPSRPTGLAYATFESRSGTTSTLEPLGGVTLMYQGGVILDLSTGNPYDPNRYLLTTKDGRELVINQSTGLESIEDPNGNTLFIDSSGIVHSSGKSISFNRDAEVRITQITDPMGNALTYTYDANGDLVSFADQENNTTAYDYDGKHNLTEYTDPRGVTSLRCEYDADGRLIATRDANGNRIALTHDLEHYTSVVRDRLGNSTIYEYNERGDVVRMVDALGNTTTYTYDQRGNQLTETDPLGNTTTFTYDAQDNLLTQKDSLSTYFPHPTIGRK
ncbi:RHS repeat protein [Candidatus Poribacteria bacterium]|nr:RHS repeat protein [Candidatus Poribacteria bacterium]